MSLADAPSRPPEVRTVVVKVGTSSLTDAAGRIDEEAVAKVTAEIAEAIAAGHRVVAVTSGAIAAGLPVMGIDGPRPRDSVTLQAISAVGQSRLMGVWDRHLAGHGLIGGQVLLAPLDFAVRDQYLHARATLTRLLELGVVPVINENDVIADDEIRFGDNDRIAALVAHLVGADTLVLLTDIAGVLTSDPRLDSNASLIEEILEVDHDLEALAGGAGTVRGSGGMATKLAAAKIASWSGVRTVIAAADRPGVVADALADVAGVGTVVRPRARTLSARKLWIAFAVGSTGTVIVDAGARRALEATGSSLLPAGVVGTDGHFGAGDAVEIAEVGGPVFAKGIVSIGDDALRAVAGIRTSGLPEGTPREVVHRDDLVVIPG